VLAIPEIWEQTRLAEDEDFQRLMQSDALPPDHDPRPTTTRAPRSRRRDGDPDSRYPNSNRRVNDGSKDDTMERLRQASSFTRCRALMLKRSQRQPLRAVYRSRTRTRLLVIDKGEGGNADSPQRRDQLRSRSPSSSRGRGHLIEPDALLRLTRPLFSSGRGSRGRRDGPVANSAW